MKRHNKERDGDRDRITLSDLTRLAGLGALLVAALMLTFTPQVLYRAVHRDGYSVNEAQQTSESTAGRNLRIRILATGQELSVRRSNFDGSLPKTPFKVWFNPAAQLKAGIVWFDERVLDPRAHPQLTTAFQALLAVAINLALGGFGLWAVFRKEGGA